MKNKCNKENRLWLRPYKACDAATIIMWCKDEESFRKWSSDRWESYPITEPEICNICGQTWNVIELELDKSDYQA